MCSNSFVSNHWKAELNQAFLIFCPEAQGRSYLALSRFVSSVFLTIEGIRRPKVYSVPYHRRYSRPKVCSIPYHTRYSTAKSSHANGCSNIRAVPLRPSKYRASLMCFSRLLSFSCQELFITKEGFQYPKNRTPKELRAYEQGLSEYRKSELKAEWIENEWRETAIQKKPTLADGQPDFKIRYNTQPKSFESDPAALRSVFAAESGAALEAQERKSDTYQEWKRSGALLHVEIILC